MLNPRIHFVVGFATVFGIQTTALQCRHCKETVLYGHGTSKKTAMRNHLEREHPILTKIYR
jgi:hypothetical protein